MATISGSRVGDKITSDSLIPFIGAGFSFPAGCPSWRELTNSLISVLADESTKAALNDLRSHLSEPDLAELLDSLALSESDLRQHLLERIDPARMRPHAYHRALVSLGCSTIVTTNWDPLLELAHREAQIPYQVIYRDEDTSLYEPARRVQILKIHGTIDDPRSLVFRKSQYENYWHERPLLGALLTTLAATKSFLFLGYGLGDPNIVSQLDRIRDWSKRAGRQHHALVYGRDGMAGQWKAHAIECINADGFRASEGNYEESTQRCLAGLLAGSRRATMSNLERSRLVNQELRRLIIKSTPQAVLRMRGALGWLSNPPADENDPIYGNYAQDLEEQHMGELVCECLDKIRGSRIHNILHLNTAPLLQMYSPSHLLRRLSVMRSMLVKYGPRIVIIHDELPSTLNHMIIDDIASVFGYKRAGMPGIPRVVSTRDRAKIADEIAQFDRDADILLTSNKVVAARLGIDVNRDDWNLAYAITLIDQEMRRLKAMIHVSPRLGEGNRESGIDEGADAVVFAILKHAENNQTREDGNTPYGVHLVRVLEWLKSIGKVENGDIQIAAALHDVVEDCGVDISEIAARWGGYVAELVAEVSQAPNATFQQYVQQIESASSEAKTIKLADRFDNVRELERTKRKSFGGLTPLQYLEESATILGVCRSANLALAQSLQQQIESARASNSGIRKKEQPTIDT